MRIEGQTFSEETVTLDCNEFIKCKFVNCVLEYQGFGTVGLEGCEFEDVNWTFTGPAANTIKFMTGLYTGAGEGGRKLIEGTFVNIKKGVSPDPGTVQ